MKKNQTAETEEMSVEAMLSLLEDYVTRMEDGDIPLEEAFALYRKGMELTQKCEERIGTLEHEVKIISESFDGEDTEE